MEAAGSGATYSSGAIVQTPDGGVEVNLVAKGIGEGRSFCDRRGDRRLEKVHCRCRVLPACRRDSGSGSEGWSEDTRATRVGCVAARTVGQEQAWLASIANRKLLSRTLRIRLNLMWQAVKATFGFCRAQPGPSRLISPTPSAIQLSDSLSPSVSPAARNRQPLASPSQCCSPQPSRHFHFLADLSGTQLSMTTRRDFRGSRQQDC